MARRITAVIASVLAAAGLTVPSAPASARPETRRAVPAFASPTAAPLSLHLYDGSTVKLGADGLGTRSDPERGTSTPVAVPRAQGRTALGDQPGPSKAELLRRFSVPQRSGASGDVVVALAGARIDGARLRAGGTRAAHTTSARINAVLRRDQAVSATPLFGGVAHAALQRLSGGASARLGGTVDLGRLYVLHLRGGDPHQAAARLSATPGVAYAEPDRYVSTMATDPTPIPSWVGAGQPALRTATPADGLPSNYGLRSSLQSYLNANGVDAVSGYAQIRDALHELPGTGEVITNVSLGDLTDASMEPGDAYVSSFGPTTVVRDGQRYLDYPSLPMIPTYTVSDGGSVNPLGSVERVDPYLGEVLLDFSMMAPLPHDRQRPGEEGSGATDLLGIAPGASYRLVEPEQPTFANIAAAMLAAGQQSPRPDVITASLGFGTDGFGFPGRYLEDDPLMRSVTAALVSVGISVTISANDGTRLYTPAPVGPDGGSTPTDLPAHGQAATSVDDDADSTAPSVVPDSGAIAVGGTTLDDTIAVPGGTSDLTRTGTFAATRQDGGTNFSSGFGTRINVSAPSDNIAALMHYCSGSCGDSDAIPVLEGGTSASAPMVAAGVADLLQVARHTGRSLTPAQVRDLLERTGRAVPTPPQIDQPLHVGPQIDLGRAVGALLPGSGQGEPSIVELSLAHRQTIGDAGASFIEAADPNHIDLQGPLDSFWHTPTGEGLVGPLTFGFNLTGLDGSRRLTYRIRVGDTNFDSDVPAVRVTPSELLQAAGQPVAATQDRAVQVGAEVRAGHAILASTSEVVTFGPTDDTHVMAPAPTAPAAVPVGSDVPVHYDLTGIPDVNKPELLVSNINHWSPYSAPIYRPTWTGPLNDDTGTITVPASAFAGGAGLYGLVVVQDSVKGVGGVAASVRVGTTPAGERPDAPTLASAGSSLGHQATPTRADPTFQLHWDAHPVHGATGAVLEISAPAPTVLGLDNTFTNQNGDRPDSNGVDTPSTATVPLPATAGTTTLDAAKLGLASSLLYTARVFATRAGHAIGQASPVSALEYDDGLAPGDSQVTSFDMSDPAAPVVATSQVADNGSPASSAIQHYQPSTGSYGSTLAATNNASAYFLYGSDPSAHTLVAAAYPWTDTTQHLLTLNTATGTTVADVPIDLASQYNLWGGRVDAGRHRAAVLAWRGSDGADTLLPVDSRTGQVGDPVTVDNGTPGPRFYNMLDIDRSTGAVDLGSGSVAGELCFVRHAGYTTVDLDTGSVAPMTPAGRCLTGVAADQAGQAELTIGPVYEPYIGFVFYPQARLEHADETTGGISTDTPLGVHSPMFPVVDPVHHLLVVGSLAGNDYLVNNNTMSAVSVYDLRTGRQVSYDERFNFVGACVDLPANFGLIQSERGIQLDPATRTAWTYGPGDTQVQQFHY
ncbi:MAG TPA: S8 family serine peptidase [Jatrophihabitans sp.]|jgi:hypothetical protein|nr:S8 family serine peptidase [Jatrophihabitans sp.]